MVEIGGKPLIWHIMKCYSTFGLTEFIICCGYKGYMFKEYFANYALHMSDVTIDLKENSVTVHQSSAEPWRVTLVDTGENTMTGGRIKRIKSYLNDEEFCLTYGDGLSDINIDALRAFHRSQGMLATVSAVKPPGRFGALDLQGDRVLAFSEKPKGDSMWVNGGYFILSPRVLDFIDGDETIWEREPLEQLAAAGQLSAYKHDGFWQPMDTLRDKNMLEDLWTTDNAPWKSWR